MRINQRIVSEPEKIDYLIVDICYDKMLVAVTNILASVPLRPFTLDLNSTLSKVKSNTWKLEENIVSDLLYVSDEDLLAQSRTRIKWIDKRNTAYSVIAPLVEDEEKRYRYLFDDKSGLLEELICLSKYSRKYVSGKLNSYWRYGSHKNALLPSWRNCGSNPTLPNKPQIDKQGHADLNNKSGPKTRFGSPFRGITKQDLDNIKKFSNQIPSGSQVRLSYLYEEFCRTYLYPRVKPQNTDAHELTIPAPRQQLISPEAFKYHLKKYVGPLVFIRKAVGEISYQKDKKGKPGLARQGLRGPTDRYEIDATIVDQYILYPYDKTEQLATGRPVIYLVADTWSGMYVGLHVCFHGPNWHGASQALFNALTDKVEFCKQYGIDISEQDWPCHHPCSQLVMDRGSEYTDRNIEGILRGKIGIQSGGFTAYHRGDAKGLVEQGFHIYQQNAVYFVPGQVLKKPQKESQHASRHAAMSFEDFMKRVIKLILYTNNNRTRVNNHNFEMTRDNVGLTPRDLYVYGLQEMVIPRAPVSVEQLRFALLPEGTATVRAEGIYFNGLYYNSNEIVRSQWLDLAKNTGRFKIRVRYDDNSTNHIWCKNDQSGEMYQLDLTDRSEAYKNQIWANVLHQVELTKQKISLHKEHSFSNKLDLLNDFDEIN
ncbi:Mu transposase C-terminal domain-containing protein, partial [Vibrio cyclitrophicus]